ncbi:hypothetical protein [Klebsiella phage vB_Kpn_IME260]|nr:hypothetical protein FDH16_gp020 [Klebsiella phage vB_Kpn_IME260]APT41066.1 hypothetical protein [Klebsiella phage vB_Kpn_IME260]
MLLVEGLTEEDICLNSFYNCKTHVMQALDEERVELSKFMVNIATAQIHWQAEGLSADDILKHTLNAIAEYGKARGEALLASKKEFDKSESMLKMAIDIHMEGIDGTIH